MAVARALSLFSPATLRRTFLPYTFQCVQYSPAAPSQQPQFYNQRAALCLPLRTHSSKGEDGGDSPKASWRNLLKTGITSDGSNGKSGKRAHAGRGKPHAENRGSKRVKSEPRFSLGKDGFSRGDAFFETEVKPQRRPRSVRSKDGKQESRATSLRNKPRKAYPVDDIDSEPFDELEHEDDMERIDLLDENEIDGDGLIGVHDEDEELNQLMRPASFEAEDLSLGYEEEDDDPDTGEDWELRSFRLKHMKLKVDREITPRQVALVEDDGEIAEKSVPLIKAVNEAKRNNNFLIKVDSRPRDNAAICKIITADELHAMVREARTKKNAGVKEVKTKEVRFTSTIEEGDVRTKTNQIQKFLKKGHRVKVVLYFKRHWEFDEDLANAILDNIMDRLDNFSIAKPRQASSGSLITILQGSSK